MPNPVKNAATYPAAKPDRQSKSTTVIALLERDKGETLATPAR